MPRGLPTQLIDKGLKTLGRVPRLLILILGVVATISTRLPQLALTPVPMKEVPIALLRGGDSAPAELTQIVVGKDRWPSEGIAAAIERALHKLADTRTEAGKEPATGILARDFKGTEMFAGRISKISGAAGLEMNVGVPSRDLSVTDQTFHAELGKVLQGYQSIRHVSFKVTSLKNVAGSQPVEAVVRFEIAGIDQSGGARQDQGIWTTIWTHGNSPEWKLLQLQASRFARQQRSSPLFQDVSQTALGGNASFHEQLNQGMDYWSRHIDVGSQIDFYGMNGIAVGDYDHDGWEDFYVCQPRGLPNRLFRNRGDGTFVDSTREAGLEILDRTASALWADYDNDGDLDLFLVGDEILLFINDGRSHFKRSERARFEIPLESRGSLMSAAMADYDRDGFLDLYVCAYSPAGTSVTADTLHQPVPYYDANNGPPNHLFRNLGNGTFSNETQKSGLSVNNNRWSFAAAWADYNKDGYADLYVASDFGRNNLYRNNGDGTFSDVARQASVEDVGAGMSACWADYDNDGWLDLYVGNIWSAAGQRLMAHPAFQPNAPSEVRSLSRQFAAGNSLFRNNRNETFENASLKAGVEVGGWAWASDFLDFDNDGWEDLYVSNGWVTNDEPGDLESFHWREVVAQSPLQLDRSKKYEEGWRRLHQAMRLSGLSAHGRERNRAYYNTGAGTFVDISSPSGLDFTDDGRGMAIVDFDQDGDLDVISKNRTAPQVRILRNQSLTGHHSVAFDLVGRQSNRDAVGAKITLKSGSQSRLKEVAVGSGFLSQHSRRIHFGLGEQSLDWTARIEWPSGVVQEFDRLPVDCVLVIEEGKDQLVSRPFRSAERNSEEAPSPLPSQTIARAETIFRGTWLTERVKLLDVNWIDSGGRSRRLSEDLQGKPLFLSFRADECEPCQQEAGEWKAFEESQEPVRVRSVSIDRGSVPQQAGTGFPGPSGTSVGYRVSEETLRVVNTLVKNLFARQRDIGIPLTLLLDSEGYLVKVYRGMIRRKWLIDDLQQLSQSNSERARLALPFSGQYHTPASSQQHQYYFGVASEYLNSGRYNESLFYFQECLKLSPDFGRALNNLGTIHLRQGRLEEALQAFQKVARLEPKNAAVQFNLGTVLSLKGQLKEGLPFMEQAVQLDPEDADLWTDLGIAQLGLGRSQESLASLEKALQLEPELARAHNNIGILYAQKGSPDRAFHHFQEAVRLQPNLAEAYVNLGIIYLNRQDRKRALEAATKAMALDPANADAKRLTDYLKQ